MRYGKGPLSPQNMTLNYIRQNITLKRIENVEKVLSEWKPKGLLDLRRFFDYELMESVYRGFRGSYKIDASKARGEAYLGLILYILFGEPEIKLSRIPNRENEEKIRRVLEKHFGEDSRIFKYSMSYLNIKIGDKNEKTGAINVEPYTFPLLGGEIFFYQILRALIEICRKVLTNQRYRLSKFMSWKEAITDRIIQEIT